MDNPETMATVIYIYIERENGFRGSYFCSHYYVQGQEFIFPLTLLCMYGYITTNNFLYKNYPKTLNVHIVFPVLDILGHPPAQLTIPT
jgi:hypothetical protein